jgi:hypothetical protein
MNLKALLILFLLVFASAITLTVVSMSIDAPKQGKQTLNAVQYVEIVPLGELIDNPVAPS